MDYVECFHNAEQSGVTNICIRSVILWWPEVFANTGFDRLSIDSTNEKVSNRSGATCHDWPGLQVGFDFIDSRS